MHKLPQIGNVQAMLTKLADSLITKISLTTVTMRYHFGPGWYRWNRISMWVFCLFLLFPFLKPLFFVLCLMISHTRHTHLAAYTCIHAYTHNIHIQVNEHTSALAMRSEYTSLITSDGILRMVESGNLQQPHG